MDSKVEAAIIAGVVALIVSIVTLVGTILTVRRQTRTQIDTVRQQTRTQIDTKIDELTQEQFKDILAKRIEVYPKLWYIAQTMLSSSHGPFLPRYSGHLVKSGGQPLRLASAARNQGHCKETQRA
jgi:hypothetical protein